MGFSGGGAVSGAASGAMMGSQIMPGWGTAIGAVAGGLMGGLSKKKKTTLPQEPMLTAEQKAAQVALKNFMDTGKIGKYEAGKDYSGKLGNYNISALEQSGQNKITGLVNRGGVNNIFDAGVAELNNILTTDKFDPYNNKGVYSGFKTNVLRDSAEATNRLKQNLAVTGNLYSTDNAKQQGLLQERTQGQLSNRLAELYNTFAERKATAAGQAVNAGTAKENVMQNRIDASQQYGQLQRMLKDAEAKAKYGDFLRKQKGFSNSISAASTLFNKNVPYGFKSTTSETPSAFSNVLNAGLESAAQAYGGRIGKRLANKPINQKTYSTRGKTVNTTSGSISLLN